jgi:hypothetical protein
MRKGAHYLHDGRAETFTEAIARHGGEAVRSAQDFRWLAKDVQEDASQFPRGADAGVVGGGLDALEPVCFDCNYTISRSEAIKPVMDRRA